MLAAERHRAGHLAGSAGDTARWVGPFGRFGYAAKGVVYVAIGGLAAAAAAGVGGSTTGARGALETIASAPFGRALLALIAAGLVGHSAWRFVQSFADPDRMGREPMAIVKRGGLAISGIVYLGLAFVAARIALGAGGGSQASDERAMTASLMSWPFGRWLVGLVAVAFACVAVYQIVKGYRASFRKRLRLSEMSQAERTWATRIGRFGYCARGFTFLVIGWFLALAAVRANPGHAKGLGETLATLAGRPYGPWLLGAAGLGLVCYGVHQWVEARYRQMTC
jgi:hypothetical protein